MRQAQELERLSQEIAARDWPRVIDFLSEEKTPKAGVGLRRRLLRQWAANDPHAAADWVSQSPGGGPARSEAINTVAIAWANQNLADAAQWVRQLPGEGERTAALSAAAYEAARTQPLEALRLGSELPAGETRDDLIMHAASQWAAQAPEDAARWAGGIPDADLRQRVLAEIATAWGESDPVAAAAFAVEALAPGKPQSDAVVGVIQRWAPKQPEAVAAWVAEFPAGTLRDTALQEIAKLQPERDHAGTPDSGASAQH